MTSQDGEGGWGQISLHFPGKAARSCWVCHAGCEMVLFLPLLKLCPPYSEMAQSRDRGSWAHGVVPEERHVQGWLSFSSFSLGIRGELVGGGGGVERKVEEKEKRKETGSRLGQSPAAGTTSWGISVTLMPRTHPQKC